MQRRIVLLAAPLILFLALPSPCNAEKIYYNDGKVINARIASRTKGNIWIDKGGGISTPVSTKKIKRIENNDGSVSKYDYAALEKMIRQSIEKAQYVEAVRVCNIFLEALPNYTRMRYLRGLLNQKLGNLKEAAEDYDFLISCMNADSKVYNNRGIISVDNQEYDEAANFFSMAISKNSKMAETHNNLANVLVHGEDYDGAIIEYKKVIALEPDNIKALHNLGAAYKKIGNPAEAEKQWKKILSINPENTAAKKALGLN